MSFLKAFQHAMIGYGIRRKSWLQPNVIYYWDSEHDWFRLVSDPTVYGGLSIFLLDDLFSSDWEAI